MTPELDALIVELERLAEKATPGPWQAKKEAFDDDEWERQFVFHAPDENTEYPCAFPLGGTKEDANAAFIAASRNAIPRLIAALRAQDAEIARLEEASGEIWDEAYAEGASETAGWEKETSHAVLQWLAKNGDGYDVDHPDGNTTDAVIQGLYDAQRIGNLQKLRAQAAEIARLREALDSAKALAVGAIANAHDLTPGSTLMVLAKIEHTTRAALGGEA